MAFKEIGISNLKISNSDGFSVDCRYRRGGGRDYFGEKAVLSLEKCIVKCYNM